MEKLKQSEHDASDVFICEIAKEDSLAFLDSSLPVDGDPSDTMPLPELEETVEESYYWSRSEFYGPNYFDSYWPFLFRFLRSLSVGIEN